MAWPKGRKLSPEMIAQRSASVRAYWARRERPMSPGMFRVVEALVEHGPMTANEIAEQAFVAAESFYNHIAPKLKRAGMIYQSGWQEYQYGYIPIYSAGVGKTPPRPRKHKTNAERNRAWKIRTGYTQRKNGKTDPVMAALMGLEPPTTTGTRLQGRIE